MLLSLVLFLYGLTLAYLVGYYSWSILQKWFLIEYPFRFHPALYPIIGLAAMSPFIGITHFFFKIDYLLHLFFLSWVLGSYKKSAIILEEAWLQIKPKLGMISLLLLGALLVVISRPGTGDIADYHLQAIKWAENFPNIIGLGNFNRPLANNNWWFNLQAFFGFSWLNVPSVYIGNVLFFILVFSWLFFSEPISKAHQWMRFFFSAFILFSYKTAFIGAVTPDFEVTLVIYLLLDLYLLAWFNPQKTLSYYLLMVLLVCWILTVKATAISFFLLLVPGLIQIVKEKNYPFLLKLIGLGCFFILPWLIGNVIISGYLLYPFPQTGLFKVDWQLPEYILKFETFSIKNWGKIPGNDIYETQKLSITQWMPIWFGMLDIFNKLLIVGFAISLPFLAWFAWIKKELRWPILFILSGFLLIFMNGPHPRFLFGYMVSAIALSLYGISTYIKVKIPSQLFLIIAVVFCSFLLVRTYTSGDLQKGLLVPKAYPKTKLEALDLNGTKVWISKNGGDCWDQFPSTYYMVDSTELRGNSLADGFRIKPKN
jgi:hypothetical protein